MHIPHPKRAFTLVELLVVIAIVAILATVLIPAISGVRVNAQKSRAVVDLRQVGGAILLYTQEHPQGMAPGAAPLGITAEYNRTAADTNVRTLGASIANYLDSREAHELGGGEREVISQLVCPGFMREFPNVQRYNVPHYVQNYTLYSRKSDELANPRVLGDQNRPDQMPPIRASELDNYGGPSRVWVLTNLDMRLPYDHPRMASSNVTASGWFNPQQIPARPVWGDSRLRLYFDGHVAFVPLDAAP